MLLECYRKALLGWHWLFLHYRCLTRVWKVFGKQLN
nr:MAG TPA: hypothetical protein [Crassvirales sp.]